MSYTASANGAPAEEPLIGDGVTVGIAWCSAPGCPPRSSTSTLAKPTSRLYDIANALYWWAPLLHARDRAQAFASPIADHRIPHRVALFADAYGMTARQRQDLMPLARRMVHRFHLTARAAAAADPGFARLWEEGANKRMPRAEAWLSEAAPAITARLTTSPGRSAT